MEAARKGFTELICDFVGVHLFGPSALTAAMDFAALFSMDVFPLESGYYPPWRYRIRKMLQYCDKDLGDDTKKNYPSPNVKALVEWLRLGKKLTAANTDVVLIQSNVITKEAYGFIEQHWSDAISKVTSFFPDELKIPYRLTEHHEHIGKLVDRIREGIPPNETRHLSGNPASISDIIASAWAYKCDMIDKKPNWGDMDEYALLFRLVLKAVESSYVHETWGEKIAGTGQ